MLLAVGGLSVAGVGVHRSPGKRKKGVLASMGGKAAGHWRTGAETTMKQTCLVCAGFGSLEMWVKTGESRPEVNAE